MATIIGNSVNLGEPGVRGDSAQFNGVLGVSTASGHAGVAGVNEAGGNGIFGRGSGNGVFGIHSGTDGAGVVGTSDQNDGVRGFSASNNHSGVVGVNTATGVGVLGRSEGSEGLAGKFEGNVEVTGDISLSNADCAEEFDVSKAGPVEPGTVMVLGEDGVLFPSQRPYDKRVAGVISGAGNYKPGIVLDKQQSCRIRKPVALLGKVFCKVDASYAPIEVGDLLTTSGTPGYAMKATDPVKAFGAVIGKALHPLTESQGMIPILVALQ